MSGNFSTIENEVSETDLKLMKECYEDYKKTGKTTSNFKNFEPPPESKIYSSNSTEARVWYTKGLEVIAQNHVAVILLSGGQGWF